MKSHGLARIGRDAELRFTPGGAAVANVSLAFTYGKRGDNGSRLTQWVDASLWGQRAESITPHLQKGKQIVAYLEDVHLQTFTKGDGTSVAKMVARLTDLEFVSDGSDTGQRSESKPQPAPAKKTAGFDGLDDDIPF